MRLPIRFQCGEYAITILDLGMLQLDGGAMFGVVPKALWSRMVEPDAANRIPLGLNCLLIEYRDEKMILDTGVGAKFPEKYLAMYGINAEAAAGHEGHGARTALDIALSSLGLTTGDITKLLLTHLHFDHAGGATKRLESGELVPVFENARSYVHEGEWERAMAPHPRSKASYLQENFLPLAQNIAFLKGVENEITPGLSFRVTGGHTVYHQVLILDIPEGGFIYWADLIPTRHHLRIPYVMGYDEYPLETMDAKKALLDEAFRKNWLHLFEHDPDYPICRLEAADKPGEYRFTPHPHP